MNLLFRPPDEGLPREGDGEEVDDEDDDAGGHKLGEGGLAGDDEDEEVGEDNGDLDLTKLIETCNKV